ncbi:MAG: hypothetical protein AAGA57_04705 [Planctomycetota bacterium]
MRFFATPSHGVPLRTAIGACLCVALIALPIPASASYPTLDTPESLTLRSDLIMWAVPLESKEITVQDGIVFAWSTRLQAVETLKGTPWPGDQITVVTTLFSRTGALPHLPRSHNTGEVDLAKRVLIFARTGGPDADSGTTSYHVTHAYPIQRADEPEQPPRPPDVYLPTGEQIASVAELAEVTAAAASTERAMRSYDRTVELPIEHIRAPMDSDAVSNLLDGRSGGFTIKTAPRLRKVMEMQATASAPATQPNAPPTGEPASIDP